MYVCLLLALERIHHHKVPGVQPAHKAHGLLAVQRGAAVGVHGLIIVES